MKQIRLIKVHVQPVFVLDDGKEITELEHPPITIPASEWKDYSSKRFQDEVKKWQDELNGSSK